MGMHKEQTTCTKFPKFCPNSIMASFLALVVLATFAYSVNAASDTHWNSIRVKWGLSVTQPDTFVKMPLTQGDAEKEGFVRIPESDTCSGTFLGFRYFKDNDLALVLLYDANGYFAGVQTAIPKNKLNLQTLSDWYNQAELFQDDVIGGTETFTLTAYHVDPAIICSTGRTESQFFESESGTQLSVQSGPNPLTDFITIPMNQVDIEKTTWTKGLCFMNMGLHFWYEIKVDMDCDKFRPFFLLYNEGKLIGFGWAVMGSVSSSVRYESPTPAVFSRIFNPVPECLNALYDELKGFTTQHVYMVDKPFEITCPV